MIVRPIGSDLLLITQLDHARLAGRMMAAWRADGFAERPTRARVLHATSEHDIGWQVVDDAPAVAADTGAPHDFMTAPLAAKQGAWPRALATLDVDPYAAALVAHHGATVYRRYDGTAGWDTFFVHLEKQRDAYLAAPSSPRQAFLTDYTVVSVGDLCSLIFCTASLDPVTREGYQVQLHPPGETAAAADTIDGGWLQLTPDPFAGATVAFDVTGRRIPARRYADDADLREALARAPTARLTGFARGSHA